MPSAGPGSPIFDSGLLKEPLGRFFSGRGFVPPPRPRASLVDQGRGAAAGRCAPGCRPHNYLIEGAIPRPSERACPWRRRHGSLLSSGGWSSFIDFGETLSVDYGAAGLSGDRAALAECGSCSSHPAAAAATTAETRVAVDVVAPPVSTRRLSGCVVGGKDLVSAGRVPASGVAAGVSVSSSAAASPECEGRVPESARAGLR